MLASPRIESHRFRLPNLQGTCSAEIADHCDRKYACPRTGGCERRHICV